MTTARAARAPITRIRPRHELHELACTGSTPDSGCVCADRPFHQPGVVQQHLEAAEEHRRRAADLVTGIEALAVKLNALPVVPLDLIERYERLIVEAHVANIKRVSGYSRAALLRLEVDR